MALIPTIMTVPVLVVSEISWLGVLLTTMLLSWMSMFRKALILSVSQFATIFSFHQISIAIFPRVIFGTLGVEEDPLLAMMILDHLPIIGTSQLRLAISPIPEVLVIEASMSLVVMEAVLLNQASNLCSSLVHSIQGGVFVAFDVNLHLIHQCQLKSLHLLFIGLCFVKKLIFAVTG